MLQGQIGGSQPLTGYQQRSMGMAPPVDPRVAALLAKMGLHISGQPPMAGGYAPHQRVANPGAGMQHPAGPGLRRATPVGAPHLRVAHQAAPIDLSTIGGGLMAIPGAEEQRPVAPGPRTAYPGPALEGGPDQAPSGLRTATGPVAPPGMPPATPQPFDEAPSIPGVQAMPGAGGQMRLGQLGRHNAIAAQLVKRLMMHRMIGRLAQPAAGSPGGYPLG